MFRLCLLLLGLITSCLVPSLGEAVSAAVLFLLADEHGAHIVKIFVGFWVTFVVHFMTR